MPDTLIPLLGSMAVFALAASISPGPVNLVALGTGARLGLRASLGFVSGATIGFTALLFLTGAGLNQVLQQHAWLARAVTWAGVAYLLYLAVQLLRDDGTLSELPAREPSMLRGAAMQWLNPKAWLAAAAGMGAYAADGGMARVLMFTVVYFAICYPSIAFWAYAGAALKRHMAEPRRIRLLNRCMALLLLVSAGYLALG